MIILSIVTAVMFLSYNYMIFELMDAVLERPRLKRVFRLPVGIINSLIVLFFMSEQLKIGSSFVAYFVISVILLIELFVFYQDKFISAIFGMLCFLIHIMAVRSACTAAFALATQKSIYEIVDNPLTLTLSICTTLTILVIACIFLRKYLPLNKLKIVKQHSEQLQFMSSVMGIFCLYLFINAIIYSTPNNHPTLLQNQIIAPIVILSVSYIMLFFAIESGKLLGYKEKSEELEHTVEKERQYRASVERDVFRMAEVNFSKNEILSGFEDYEEKLGDIIHNYNEMLAFMITATVHIEDAPEFTKYSSPLTVIEEFEQGKTEISFDYRRLMPDGIYVWMRVLMPLMLDTETGDVMGFVQIKDIDEEKKQQLELLHKAERDLLTGLYNKGTTEELITEYFTSDKAGTHAGVLFVIDIDNFKTINDRLGHLYGDAVLSELSESLLEIFREYDIVGRIGGDEFLVFAKGTFTINKVIKKANEICKAFLRSYANERSESYTVSSSIGIAFFPEDGNTYEKLFQCADAALYTAKANGKNCYSFFESEQELSYVSTRTEIDTHGAIQKSFKDNRIEYVFRLLYGSEDTKAAIEATLELIAKNFGFSRANIFEFNELSTHFSGVFEWCANGIDSVIDNYRDMPVSSFDFVVAALEQSGGMFAAVPGDFPDYAQESYTSIGIKSIVHFSIKERDKLIGVVAFQNCIDEKAKLSGAELEELRVICQVLSVFMAKQLSGERELSHHKSMETVMDNMNSIAYVIDRESHEVYYENQIVVDITGHSSVGSKCHLSYRGLDTPCEDCPLSHLSMEKPRCTLELYTEKFDLYTKTSAALIDWTNDRKAMLISSVDITEYKRSDSPSEG